VPPSNGIPNIPGTNGGAASGPDQIREEDVQMREPTPTEQALSQLELTALGLNPFDKSMRGLKFGVPDMPVGKLHETKFHMKYRYDEGTEQLTKLLMRHGKLSKAQNVRGLPCLRFRCLAKILAKLTSVQ
jgi:hypothetical protein